MHDTHFQDAVEKLQACIDRVHNTELSHLESEAREELADLCELFLSEYHNPPTDA